jgi:glycosyltransferase involved in cell wall biosynthesis
LLLWSHVNGLFPPYTIPEKLFDFVDFFIFTSPVSYECNVIKNLSDANKKKLSVIWSTVGTEGFDNLKRFPHTGFNVGYIGTADFGKLNNNFINLCSNVNIPDVRFVVISGDSQQHLVNEAIDAGIWDNFTFLGQVPRIPFIPKVLSKVDVFGYPLQHKNFATCEQALGEAMMAGCVPVVLANPPEKHIIKHMETGIIANTLEEYPRAIEYLYKNPDELGRMSKSAKAYAKGQYDINKTILEWNKTFEKVMELKKQIHRYSERKTCLPHELYIESLDEYGSPLDQYVMSADFNEKEECKIKIKQLFDTNSMFFSDNKGSVLQYLHFFSSDKTLQDWASIIDDKQTSFK